MKIAFILIGLVSMISFKLIKDDWMIECKLFVYLYGFKRLKGLMKYNFELIDLMNPSIDDSQAVKTIFSSSEPGRSVIEDKKG